MRLLVFVTVLLMLAIMIMDVEARGKKYRLSKRRVRQLVEMLKKNGIELTSAERKQLRIRGFLRKVPFEAPHISAESYDYSESSEELFHVDVRWYAYKVRRISQGHIRFSSRMRFLVLVTTLLMVVLMVMDVEARKKQPRMSRGQLNRLIDQYKWLYGIDLTKDERRMMRKTGKKPKVPAIPFLYYDYGTSDSESSEEKGKFAE